MMSLALAAVFAAGGFGVLIWKWKRGATSILLAALPIALVLPVLQVAPSTWAMIRAFQQIAQTGAGGVGEAFGPCLGISRSLFWGTIGFAVLMGIAAALQALAVRDTAGTAPEEQPRDWPRGLAEAAILVGSSLLVLPSIALIHLAAGIPRIIVLAVTPLTGPPGAVPATGSLSATEFSDIISSRLLGSMLIGIALSLLVLIAATACLVALRVQQPSRRLILYSWIMSAACTALAIWYAFQLGADIRSTEMAMRPR